MSNYFKNFSEALETNADYVVGSANKLPSDIYPANIKMAHMVRAQSGAIGVKLVLETALREYTETIYVSNNNGENSFINKKTGKKSPLAGFTHINELSLLVTNKPLTEQTIVTKQVKQYDPTDSTHKIVPTDVLIDLLGTRVQVAISLQEKNKEVKTSTGIYMPTAETYTVNVIEKFLDHITKQTHTERLNNASPEYANKWLELHKNKVRNMRKLTVDTGTAGVPMFTTSTPETPAKPTVNLFG